MIEAKRDGELEKFRGNRSHLNNVLDNLRVKLDKVVKDSYLPVMLSAKNIKALENYLIGFRRNNNGFNS